MSIELSTNHALPWNERIIHDINLIDVTLSEFDCWCITNEVKLSILLESNSFKLPSTMDQLQDIVLALLILDWSSSQLCKSYGSILAACIQASHLLEYQGDNPVLSCIEAISWKPFSIAIVCDALTGAYESLNDNIISLLQDQVSVSIETNSQLENLRNLVFSCSKLLTVSGDPSWWSLLRSSFSALYSTDGRAAISCFAEVAEEVSSVSRCIVHSFTIKDGTSIQTITESDLTLLILSIDSLSSSHSIIPLSNGSDDLTVECIKCLLEGEIKSVESCLHAVIQQYHNVGLPVSLLRNLLTIYSEKSTTSFRSNVASIKRKSAAEKLLGSIILLYFRDACDDNTMTLLVKTVEDCFSKTAANSTLACRELILSVWCSVCTGNPIILVRHSAILTDMCSRLLALDSLPLVCPVIRPMLSIIGEAPRLQAECVKLQSLFSDQLLKPSNRIAHIGLMATLLKSNEVTGSAIVDTLFTGIKQLPRELSGVFRRELYVELIQLLVNYGQGNGLANSTLTLIREHVDNILQEYGPLSECFDKLLMNSVNDINSVSCLLVDDVDLLLQLSFRLDVLLHPEEVKIGLVHICRVLLQLPDSAVDAMEVTVFGNNSEADNQDVIKSRVNGMTSVQFILSVVDYMRYDLSEIINIEEIEEEVPRAKGHTARQGIEDIRLGSARCVAKLSVVYGALNGLASCLVAMMPSSEKCFLYALPVVQVLLGTVVAVCPVTEEDGTSKTVVISTHSAMTSHYIANLSGMDYLAEEAEQSGDYCSRCFMNRCSWSAVEIVHVLNHVESLLTDKAGEGYLESLRGSTPISMKWSVLSHTCYALESFLERGEAGSVEELTSILESLDSLYTSWFAMDDRGLSLAVESYKKISTESSYSDKQGAKNKGGVANSGFQGYFKPKADISTVDEPKPPAKASCPLLFEDFEYDNNVSLNKWSEVSTQHIQNSDLLPYLRLHLTVLLNESPKCKSDLECFDVSTSKVGADDSKELYTAVRTSVVRALSSVSRSLHKICWQSAVWSSMSKKFVEQFIELISTGTYSESLFLAYLELIQSLHEGWLLQDMYDNQLMTDLDLHMLQLLRMRHLGQKKTLVPPLLDVALSLSGANDVARCCSLIESILSPFIYWKTEEQTERTSMLLVVHTDNITLTLDHVLTYIIDFLRFVPKSEVDALSDVTLVLSSLLRMFEPVEGDLPIKNYSIPIQHKIMTAVKVFLVLCVQELRKVSVCHSDSQDSSDPLKLSVVSACFVFVLEKRESLTLFLQWMRSYDEETLRVKIRDICSELSKLRELCQVHSTVENVSEERKAFQEDCERCCIALDIITGNESDEDEGFEMRRPKKARSQRIINYGLDGREVVDGKATRKQKRRRSTTRPVEEVRSRHRGLMKLMSKDDGCDTGVDMEDWIVQEEEEWEEGQEEEEEEEGEQRYVNDDDDEDDNYEGNEDDNSESSEMVMGL